MKRRTFVQTSAAAGAFASVGGLSLISGAAHAERPDQAFISNDVAEVMKQVFGDLEAQPHDMLKIEAPLQAENGSVVPVQITAEIPGTEKVALVIDNNPTPLLTVLDSGPRHGGFYSLRVKMAGSDKVHAYALAEGKLYIASQDVRVAVGGCGG